MPPILQRPEPEIETLSWSPRPPSTSDRREIEEDDRVRRLKPDLKRVIWSQVAIQNPVAIEKSIRMHGSMEGQERAVAA